MAHDRPIQLVVETPRGSRNKYKFVPDGNRFELNRILPPGCAFPFDFGFVPDTLAEDGDPLDVLILTDEALAMGCVVDARVIGVIEASQQEGRRKPVRNDRLVATVVQSQSYRSCTSLADIDDEIVRSMEQFFVTYHALQMRRFRPIRRGSSRTARAILQAGRKRFEQKQNSPDDEG